MKVFILGLPKSGRTTVSNSLGKDLNIIEGLVNPQEFISSFDCNYDLVVFLNRIDNELEPSNADNIAISVMRDYCYWLAAIGNLPKERWLEFNFRIPGETSDMVKTMGSKNSIFLVKSLDKVISILKEKLNINL